MSTPYRDRVIGLDSLPLLREVVAALLIVGGLILLVIVAFKADTLLGLALVAVLAVAVGFALALAPRSKG